MDEKAIVKDDSWKTKMLLIGAVLGLLTGIGTAYMLTQRAAEADEPPPLSAGEGLKVSLLLLGLIRQIIQVFE